MEQKPERAPCLSTISCGVVFVTLSCVSMGAECDHPEQFGKHILKQA